MTLCYAVDYYLRLIFTLQKFVYNVTQGFDTPFDSLLLLSATNYCAGNNFFLQEVLDPLQQGWLFLCLHGSFNQDLVVELLVVHLCSLFAQTSSNGVDL